MTHARRFRFGVQINKADDGPSWAAVARKAEDLGYDTFFMPDHFGDQLAPVPALMAAADATTDLRIGALVFDNDYKHPVVLAKEIATLDVLSGGRVELGIGAGWMTTDYEQSGIPHDPAGVRVSRMEEGIAVLKGMFAEGAYSFTGDHYTISGLDGRPKPLQRPHPPFLIGGGGRRVLSIAARQADIVGINPSLRAGVVDASAAADATAAATDRKLAWVREAAGDRFDELEINCLMLACLPTDDAAATIDMMAAMFGVDPTEVPGIPHVLIGTVDEMCEALEQRRERWGMSYFVTQEDSMEALAPVVARLAGT